MQELGTGLLTDAPSFAVSHKLCALPPHYGGRAHNDFRHFSPKWKWKWKWISRFYL